MSKRYDVIVIGGGPSGTMAAWAAARQGAKTLLIEQGAFLGGMLTRAGVGPMMSFHAGEKQVVMGLPEKMHQLMVAEGFSPGHMLDFVGFAPSVTPFDAEGLKHVWETTLLKDGVELLYFSRLVSAEMDCDRIAGIKVLGLDKIHYFEAEQFVDCAGGSLAAKTPCEILYGRSSDGLTQPMTTNFKVTCVDRGKLIKFIQNNPEDMYDKTPFDQLEVLPRTGISGAFSFITKAQKKKDLTIDRHQVLAFETNRKGEFIINMSRVSKLSSLSSVDMTAAEIEGRRQVREIYAFLKHYIPGFEDCELLSSGPYIGVREGRRIQATYQLNANDLLENRTFYDAIAVGGYPIDVHSPDGRETQYRHLKEGSWYQIPYRSLISPKVVNMVVAGRSLGAEHEALSAVRVSPILQAVGQAAGTAAALSTQEQCTVHELNISCLQKKLRDEGAFLAPFSTH